MKGLLRVFPCIFHYWKTTIGALFSLLVVNFGSLAMPQLLRGLIDDGISQKNLSAVWLAAAGMVAIAIVRGVFTFLQGYWSEITSQGVAYELRNAVFEKLQKLSFSYHDQAQTGKLMTRMTSDVELVRNFAGAGFLNLLGAALLLIGTLVVLFSMNALLTAIFLLMIPPIAALFSYFVVRVFPLSYLVQEKLGALNTVLQENLAGIRVVRAFAREDYESNRFSNHNQALLAENIRLLKMFSFFFPVVFLIANIGMAGVVWAGGLRVIADRMTLGELVAFIGYQGFLLMPIFMIGFIATALSRAEVSSQRIFEVIDARSEVEEKPNAVELGAVRGQVVFDHVSFRYAGSEQYALKDISFEVLPNQTVAILGSTGSGKSSVINLIPRFYDVSDGRILIDGRDVRDVRLSSLRSQIGIVLQETTLFSGTIRENIAYGCPECDLERIKEVALAAQAHDFIEDMPEGYETVIGERGVGLSGGQKQRIAIARALLLNPRILIMDDSTSSVDAETEYKIQQALERLRQGRTTFIIAQRLSTVRNADLILLIDQGKLVAQGKHADLLACCELYADILATQFDDRAELLTTLEKEVL